MLLRLPCSIQVTGIQVRLSCDRHLLTPLWRAGCSGEAVALFTTMLLSSTHMWLWAQGNTVLSCHTREKVDVSVANPRLFWEGTKGDHRCRDVAGHLGGRAVRQRGSQAVRQSGSYLHSGISQLRLYTHDSSSPRPLVAPYPRLLVSSSPRYLVTLSSCVPTYRGGPCRSRSGLPA